MRARTATTRSGNDHEGARELLLEGRPDTAVGSPTTGNYALNAQFGTVAAKFNSFGSNTLTEPGAAHTSTVYVGESQFLHLVLSAGTGGATPATGAGVQMDVLDANGTVVYTLTAAAGDTVSGDPLFLMPGAYTIRYTALGASGPALNYALLGEGVSDPIGPVLFDPTLSPIYTDPTLPSFFMYPGGIITTDPIWIIA